MGKEIKVLEEWKIDENQYKCPFCSFVTSKKGIGGHVYFKHMEKGQNAIEEIAKDNSIRNKGKTGHPMSLESRKKISEGSEEILDSIRAGYVSYVISTRDVDSINQETDGTIIRRCAVENNVAMFSALETVKVLLDILLKYTM